MSFFSFLFGKNKKEKNIDKIKIYSPIEGEFVNIEDVEDETFSKKLLGNGIAIKPSNKGIIKAPIEGKLVQLFESNHAFVIETKDNINVLVHFGLNTVNLKGKGFERVAKEGSKVNIGDEIIRYDYDYLIENADSIITLVVIIDSEEYKNIKIKENTKLEIAKTEIIEIEL